MRAMDAKSIVLVIGVCAWFGLYADRSGIDPTCCQAAEPSTRLDRVRSHKPDLAAPVRKPIRGAEYPGFLQPWETVEVAVSEPGRVSEVRVRAGDRVRRDDLIAQLDDAVLRASLEVARQRATAGGQLQVARAKLDHAAAKLDDIASLLKEDHASQSELDQAELEFHQAEAELLIIQEQQDVASADLKRIEAQLARRQVRSPMDGVVIDIHRRAGEYAGAADPVIATVVALDRLRLPLHVPTSVAVGLHVGMPIDVEFAEIETTVEGTVDFISPVTDSPSGTVRVDIRFNNNTKRLRGGLLGVWKAGQSHVSANLTRRRSASRTAASPSNRMIKVNDDSEMNVPHSITSR